MEYQYVGYNESKRIIRGSLASSSLETATQTLKNRGYYVISLKPVKSIAFDIEKYFPSLYQVKTKTVILFLRELALLLESGTNIVSAFELLQNQTSSRTFKRVLGEITGELHRGSHLSAALEKHPKVFPPLFCRSLSAGEQSGGMEATLKQIADYMEKSLNTRKGLKTALSYPAIVVATAIVVVVIMANFVLPTFANLYKTLGTNLPLPTQILLTVTDLLRKYGFYLLVTLGFAVVGTILYIKTPQGRNQWDRLALKAPVIGEINHLTELATCSRTMSMLYKSGLSLVDILSALIEACSNRVMAGALRGVQRAMIKGEGLSRPMSENEMFLPLMVEMVRVGEETGTLENTLLTVAETYETEAADRTQTLISYIQPAIIIVIGAVVAFIAVSMLTAMYDFYGQMNL